MVDVEGRAEGPGEALAAWRHAADVVGACEGGREGERVRRGPHRSLPVPKGSKKKLKFLIFRNFDYGVKKREISYLSDPFDSFLSI